MSSSCKLYVPDHWKRWIAENVLRGGTADDLAPVLIREGFPDELARLEIDVARSHPYLAAAASISRQKDKRDWVLNSLRRLRAMNGDREVERRATITGDDFFARYYCRNLPLILTGEISEWQALRLWSQGYLIEKVGGETVQIQAKRNGDPLYELRSEAHRQAVRFADFARQVFSGTETNDVYMTANNAGVNSSLLKILRPDLGALPHLLDDANRDAQTFFWMGPAGTVTPLHHDLTNNLMIQIIGRKRVLLLEPEYLPLIYNHFHCYSMIDPEAVDLSRFPLLRDVQFVEVTLNPGEVLFLPVGWWHHVRGLDPTITITCTNFRLPNTFHDNYRTFAEI
ncbi:MAG: cupin-like domain-containing protein [Planctomycetaceae bacterium]